MATYDREAIEAFSKVFDEAREQIEKIRDTMLDPEIRPEEFGTSWHREGDEFIASARRVSVDLGNLEDILSHIHDTMLDNASNFQAQDSSAGDHYLRMLPEGAS